MVVPIIIIQSHYINRYLSYRLSASLCFISFYCDFAQEWEKLIKEKKVNIALIIINIYRIIATH